MTAEISTAVGAEATKLRLESATLQLLTGGGLLSGFTLQQVGEEAGVAKALVYHYYGDRQTLLRSALRHNAAQLQELLRSMPYHRLDRRLATFVQGALRFPGAVQVMTLLLIDHTPRLRTMPIRERTMSDFGEDLRLGNLPLDTDVDALLGVQNALVYGYILFREGLARQMGVERDALDSRFRRLVPGLGRRAAIADWAAAPVSLPVVPKPVRPKPNGAAERLEAAAIELIDEQGILAGLNLRTVAERASVARGLVYHYFGSRRELLRSALRRRLQTGDPQLGGDDRFGGAFFAGCVAQASSLRLLALLALDGDDSYEPFEAPTPSKLTTRRMAAVCAGLGHAIYREAFARESGVSLPEWDRRVFAAWCRVAP